VRGVIEQGYVRDGLAVATFDRICMTSITSSITSEYLREANRAGAELSRRTGGKIFSLTLLRSDAPLPDAALRDEASRISKASNQRVAAAAHVVHGEGFAASTMRSVLTAMTFLSGGAPRRTFAKSGPALDWLANHMTVPPSDLAPVLEWSERALRGG
jgi:hypothetical protein